MKKLLLVMCLLLCGCVTAPIQTIDKPAIFYQAQNPDTGLYITYWVIGHVERIEADEKLVMPIAVDLSKGIREQDYIAIDYHVVIFNPNKVNFSVWSVNQKQAEAERFIYRKRYYKGDLSQKFIVIDPVGAVAYGSFWIELLDQEGNPLVKTFKTAFYRKEGEHESW